MKDLVQQFKWHAKFLRGAYRELVRVTMKSEDQADDALAAAQPLIDQVEQAQSWFAKKKKAGVALKKSQETDDKLKTVKGAKAKKAKGAAGK